MIDLRGKRALVCGSTRGIGRACAEVLARQGAEITLVARDETLLKEVAGQLDRAGGQTHQALCADFQNPDALREKVTGHVAQTGPLEILINNTGGPPAGPIFEAKPEDFLKAFTMHVVCNHILVQTLVPGMREKKYGRIINIISTSVRQPIPGLGVSNTTRAAVASWAKTLSGELGSFGITVNNILPGYTWTDRLRSLMENRAKHGNVSVEQVEAAMRADIPAGRFGRSEEIAAAVAFLASPAAAYVNGVSLPVDGGRISAL